MDADQMAVAGQPDITFQRVGPFSECALIGGQGVLGNEIRRTPVGDDEGTFMRHLSSVGRRDSIPPQPYRTTRERGTNCQITRGERRESALSNGWPAACQDRIPPARFTARSYP